MTGCEAYFPLHAAGGDLFATREIVIGLGTILHDPWRKTIHVRDVNHPRPHLPFDWVSPQGCVALRFELLYPTTMIEMRMGEPDSGTDEPALLQCLEDLVGVSARVDDRCGRIAVPKKNTAILFERGDGDGEYLNRAGFHSHSSLLEAWATSKIGGFEAE